MNTAELQRLLAPIALVRHFYVHDSLDSTMEHARRMVASAFSPQALHGTLVLTEMQTLGRGRHGRRWTAPAGSSLLATIILAQNELPGEHDIVQLSLLAAALPVAVCNGVRGVLPVARIKFPNDIVIEDRKLGGVLLETCGATVLAGFGVNCTQQLTDFPGDLKMPATSIFLETGKAPSREELTAVVMANLARLLEPAQFAAAGDEMRSLCETIGKSVVLDLGNGNTVMGLAETITQEGVLMLKTNSGTQRIYTTQVVRTWSVDEEQPR